MDPKEREFQDRFIREIDRSRMLYVAGRIVGAEWAEDVLQDACLQGWRNYASFRVEGSFPAWFHTIIHHTAINYLRGGWRREMTSLDELPSTETDQVEPSPEDRMLEAEDSQEVRRALEELWESSPEFVEAIRLRFTEDLSYGEIGTLVEISENLATQRVHRGLKALKKLFRARHSEQRKRGERARRMASQPRAEPKPKGKLAMIDPEERGNTPPPQQAEDPVPASVVLISVVDGGALPLPPELFGPLTGSIEDRIRRVEARQSWLVAQRAAHPASTEFFAPALKEAERMLAILKGLFTLGDR